MHRGCELLDDVSASWEEMQELRQLALAADQEFAEWRAGIVDDWKPRMIGKIDECQKRAWSPSTSGRWPGNVDSYFDRKDYRVLYAEQTNRRSVVYVAVVLNTYRKNHLMALNVIVTCSKGLGIDDDIRRRAEKDARRLAAEIIASIPYYLTGDSHTLQTYVQETQTGKEPILSGRPVGGLLLMHPLYISACLHVVPLAQRAHMSGCLAWIGKNMGIGQASILANASGLLSSDR
jgi:hypothetical protein